MAQYNDFQQTFTLSLYANGLIAESGKKEKLEQKLTEIINKRFLDNIDNIGQWKIEWGPVVFQKDPNPNEDSVADNVMYVASQEQADKKVYVVAIAGTNPNSSHNQLLNFWVYETALWKDNKAKISKGTEEGLNNLLGMRYKEQNLAEFLNKIENKNSTRIIFTGHSLGGVLASVLALELMTPNDGSVPTEDNNPYNKYGLRKSDWNAVYVYQTCPKYKLGTKKW